MNEALDQKMSSLLGHMYVVNDHMILITPTLTIVGDIPSSADQSIIDVEVNSILDDALNTPYISDKAKQNIRSCREQGKVSYLDPDTTLATYKDIIFKAAKIFEKNSSDTTSTKKKTSSQIDIDTFTDDILTEIKALKQNKPPEPDVLAKEEYLKKRGADFKTEKELLDNSAQLDDAILIKEFANSLLKQRDYTEKDLKAAVWARLISFSKHMSTMCNESNKMDAQDSGKNVSENFFQEIFKEESPARSEPPVSLDQEASVGLARTLFSQNLEDAASIMNLVKEIESLGEENLAARKARIELFSLVLARALTKKELYRNGLFLPSFEENLQLAGYHISILALPCVVLIRNVDPSRRQSIIKEILEAALTSNHVSKEGLAVLKLCITTDRVITLNKDETKEVYDKGWEKHEELFHQWRSKAPSVLAQREHPRIQAFFEQQQRIGSEWPEVLYPMKYDISIYRQADENCYSTIDSPDWRKREISIRVTDAAIDLLDEVLRTPIIEASCKAFSNPDRPHGKELMKDHFLCKFPYSAVPDLTRIKPQETQLERYRFPGNNESKTVVVSVPQTTLIEIARKIATFLSFPEGIPGTVFGNDIFKHLFSIFMTLMQPEYACMRSLEGNPKAPLITGEDHREQTFSLASMFNLLQFETARRVLKQGMNPRLVDSLAEPYVLLEEEGDAERVKGMIIHGQSWEGIGLLSW